MHRTCASGILTDTYQRQLTASSRTTRPVERAVLMLGATSPCPVRRAVQSRRQRSRELGKRFGASDSYKYVNGVLDKSRARCEPPRSRTSSTKKTMDEFELIRRYFAEPTPLRPDVALGIGDDAALLAPPRGSEVVVTTDTLVGGRHFPDDTDPQAIGWKALAVNLSDLAAMGAEPRWFALAPTLRMVDPEWLSGFCAGLAAMAREVRRGAGRRRHHPGRARSRSARLAPACRQGHPPLGAKVGDAICVTGTLGDAALALRLGQGGGGRGEARSADLEKLRARLNRPAPRVAVGAAPRDITHAAIDLSDGLAGDLSHILDVARRRRGDPHQQAADVAGVQEPVRAGGPARTAGVRRR